MSGITRRQFVVGTAAAAAGAWLSSTPLASAGMMGGGGMGGGGMGGGGMGGSTATIDPPVGALLRDVPVLANETPLEAGVYQVSVTAQRAVVDVNGKAANLLTYNGQNPGPAIRVRRDQLLRLKFTNALPDDGQVNMLGHPTRVTNIHTHGLHVTPGDNMNGTHGDNMMVMTMPGADPEMSTATYEYDLSMHPPGNLNFYHPHIHGCVADQMWGGMSAPLVIEDETSALAAFEEHVLVLKDITLAGSEPAPHTSMMEYMHGKEGDTVLVNGQVNPRLNIRPGQVQRWRVVNACTARFFRLSLQGHSMYVVGVDGGLLDKPYRVSEFLLSPGERLDLLVKADARTSASYKWLSLPYSRMGMTGGQQVTLMTLTYKGTKANQAIPALVDPTARRVDPSSLMISETKTFTLSMGQGSGYINGIKYQGHEDCFVTTSMVMPGMTHWEIWDVVNQSGMDHPFHHHVNSAQVLSITGGDPGYAALLTGAPAWKDVTIVPKMGRVRLLMPVADYTGMAMLHCHIIEHEDIGMMGVWDLMGEGGMGDM